MLDSNNLLLNSLNRLVLLTDYWIYFSLSKVKGEPIYQEHWIPLLLQVQYINRRCILVLSDSNFFEAFSNLGFKFHSCPEFQ